MSRNPGEVLWLAPPLWGSTLMNEQRAGGGEWQVINPRVKSARGVSPKQDGFL